MANIRHLVIAAIFLTGFAIIQAISRSEMEAFKSQQVTVDVINQLPDQLLQVSWKGEQVEPGTEMSLSEASVKAHPDLKWDADPKAFYALLMVDPDAPSRQDPVNAEWAHWIVVNIPGGDVAAGQVILNYAPPSPPKGTGLHRYVLMVVQQNDKQDFATVSTRAKFSSKSFLKEHLIDHLVAANFILVQNKH